jgi:hypothetical protein
MVSLVEAIACAGSDEGSSGVSFYVVPPAPEAAVSAEASLPARALEEDRRLHEWGPESLAVEAHGAFVREVPERAFERVLRETTGFSTWFRARPAHPCGHPP